jgi:hypothetical protein
MSEDFKLLSDGEIAAQIRAGMTPQATLRVQARQMKALDRIATTLEALLAQRGAYPVMPPPVEVAAAEAKAAKWRGDEDVIEPLAGPLPTAVEHLAGQSPIDVGPATDLDDAGTPRARRRRSA